MMATPCLPGPGPAVPAACLLLLLRHPHLWTKAAFPPPSSRADHVWAPCKAEPSNNFAHLHRNNPVIVCCSHSFRRSCDQFSQALCTGTSPQAPLPCAHRCLPAPVVTAAKTQTPLWQNYPAALGHAGLPYSSFRGRLKIYFST